MTAARHYTLQDAQAFLPRARDRVLALTEVVGRLREVSSTSDVSGRRHTVETVAMLQDELDGLLAWFERHDVRIASLAPILLDFPARAILEGEPLDVLLCWRDDEETIAYYHRPDAGYRGRQPVALLERV